jgi:hypothetical protein
VSKGSGDASDKLPPVFVGSANIESIWSKHFLGTVWIAIFAHYVMIRCRERQIDYTKWQVLNAKVSIEPAHFWNFRASIAPWCLKHRKSH